MFGKQRSTHVPEPALNEEVELTVRVNCFLLAVNPRPGTLAIGERGLDFRADKGEGFVLVPYEFIDTVVCDVVGRNVHAAEVVTVEGMRIRLVFDRQGAEAVRALASHLDRSQLMGHEGNLKRIARRARGLLSGLFGRRGQGEAA